jgi:hypothetical protein
VLDVVERLDLEAIYAVYRASGQGRPAHDPRMMVALLCTRTRWGSALRAGSSVGVWRMWGSG